jgi:hypothetical protein
LLCRLGQVAFDKHDCEVEGNYKEKQRGEDQAAHDAACKRKFETFGVAGTLLATSHSAHLN